MATRKVEVSAKGKRAAFSFEYDAPTSLKEALAQASEEAVFQGYLANLDHVKTIEHTESQKAESELYANFTKSLRDLSKVWGLDKTVEVLMAQGGFEALTQEELNAAIDSVKNPKPRKPREKKVKTETPKTN